MVIPKIGRLMKKQTRYCIHSGCNKEFYGIPIAKYCEEHRASKFVHMRKDKKISISTKVNSLCKTIENKSLERQNLILTCNTCGQPFNHLLYPKIFIIPSNCPEHRTEHRRELYIRKHSYVRENNKESCMQ